MDETIFASRRAWLGVGPTRSGDARPVRSRSLRVLRVRAVLALAFIAALGDDASAQALTAISAYHEDGSLWFVAPPGSEWADLSPERLRQLPIPTSDTAIVNRFRSQMDMFGNVESKTPVSAPADLASLHLYFVGSGGVQPFRVDSTLVVTRLTLDPRGTTIQRRTSWGEVFGSPERPDQGGGFVLRFDERQSFEEGPAEFSADDIFLTSQIVASGPDGRYHGQGTAFWEIEGQYRFTVGGTPGAWLFVHWAADRENHEGGCAFRYDLLRLEAGRAVSRVASNSYRCDV